MSENKKYDLHERLIRFSILILKIVDHLPKSYTGFHFARQLVRCGTVPAFHHAEAQSAESRRDFIHKMKIAVKVLRETYINLKIIKRKPLMCDKTLEEAIVECNELISIFVKSIQTARKNLNRKWFKVVCSRFFVQCSSHHHAVKFIISKKLFTSGN